jgi:hypothetical protein
LQSDTDSLKRNCHIISANLGQNIGQVESNDKAKLLWDTPIITHRSAEANRPDLVFFDKKAETSIAFDIAIPLDDNLEISIPEKKRKHLLFAVELRVIYKLRSNSIVPQVMSTNGLFTKEWSKSMEKLQLHERPCRTMHKAAVLGTANIVRKILSLD